MIFEDARLQGCKLKEEHRRLNSSAWCVGDTTLTQAYPDLPFLVFFGKKQGKPPKKQGFFFPSEALKSLGKKGKTLKKARNSLQEKKARNSKKARKGRSG